MYPAGEQAIPGADSKNLCRSLRQRGKEPLYIASPADLPQVLSEVLHGDDLVLTQGAGNIGQLVKVLADTQLDIEKLKQVNA